MSEFAFGTMTFGREADEATSHRMLDLHVERGGNLIDTADVYGNGIADEVFARWLASRRRDDFVIASKVRFPTGSGMNDVGLSRKHILVSVEASLRRLGTDHLDLFQIHCRDRGTPIEETLTTLDQLVRDGKVRYLGSSNLRGWQLQKLIDTHPHRRRRRLLEHQPSPRSRGVREPPAPVQPARSRDRVGDPRGLFGRRGGRDPVGTAAWRLAQRGYRREMGGAPEGSRAKTAEHEGWAETWDRYDNERTWGIDNERTWGIVDELDRIASIHGTTPAVVAIRWVEQHPVVTAPILGASRFEQLEASLAAIDVELTAADMEALDRVSRVEGSYPYDSFIDDAQAGR